MGTLKLLTPNQMPTEMGRELERASLIGGPDNMPWPCHAEVKAEQLVVHRSVDESGCLVVPWEVPGAGLLMNTTGTLMERDLPYQIQVELARGKINQLRCQSFDWKAGGLQMPSDLAERIRDASLEFGRAATAAAGPQAQESLRKAHEAADDLVQLYIDQVFRLRHERQPILETLLGCRLGNQPPSGEAAHLLATFATSVQVPLGWKEVEPSESNYSWEAADTLIAWAESRQLDIRAGPLIDFHPDRLPGWLTFWQKDLQSIASFMCDYVETVIKRYHGRVQGWQLTSGSNFTKALGLGEDELLWLTVRLAEAARQIDSTLELVAGLVQPWGDYLAQEDHTHSPFVFADTLIRAGINLAAVDLELVHGTAPYGSYCRDLLDTSRLLDLYALLGVPIQVTLGYPALAEPDPNAEPGMRVGAGHWRNGFRPEAQADWASAFAALALCKPFVRAVNWIHLSDAQPHLYPNCGLLDAHNQPRPALRRLRDLSEQHLR